MEKKKIIGAVSFEGSNTTYIFAKLHYLLRPESCTIVVYSLEKHDQECVCKMIEENNDEEAVHIIDKVSTLEEIAYFAEKFADHDFEAIGIQIPWDECFTFLQKHHRIAEDCPRNEWRAQNEQSEYRNRIMKCFEKIGTDHIYRYNKEIVNEAVGRIADDILR